MRIRRATAGLALAGLLIASPVTATAGGAGATVTGGGWFLFNGSIPMQFSFSAVSLPDGSVSGTFHHSYFDGNFYDFHGVVTCLSHDAAEGRAWIGGVLTHVRTDDPGLPFGPGDDAWFRVLDSVAGDRSTTMGFVGSIPSSEAYCATQPWPEDNARTHPVTSGQVTVNVK